MSVPTRNEITGLILAGGRAARMGGVDKGLVDFKGKPLIAHVIERLQPQVGDLMISANRNLERYRALGLPIVLDETSGLEPFPGPLAGWLAGLRACKTNWMVCVPCDAPFLAADLVHHLADTLSNSRAAVAYLGQFMEPMFCLLHVDLAEDLAQAVTHGERKAEAWLRGMGAAQAEFLHAEPFANLNSMEDVQARDERP